MIFLSGELRFIKKSVYKSNFHDFLIQRASVYKNSLYKINFHDLLSYELRFIKNQSIKLIL